MRFLAFLVVPLLLACASTGAPARRAVDSAAEDYVRLALEVDVHEEGYVDAYFGPGEWREEARARPRSVEQLKLFAETIAEQLTHIAEHDPDETSVRRARTMLAGVQSARFRLDMIGGARAPFLDEAERLFALRPALRPLESFEPALARIDALLPGAAPLIERFDAFRAQYVIPFDRLRAVMDRAIAECRTRTAAHLPLPDGENFRMEFVTGQSWSAYNWYQGGNQSLIQVNTDQPVTIDRALTLACHEGYPGHHVQGIYNERLYRERGWTEYSVAPLYHPSSPMNEGAGNFGVELAFPGEERLAFERDVLYPLAGLDPATAARYGAVQQALNELAFARLTIAAMYLNGEVNREAALSLMERHQLMSRSRAEQSRRFTEHYRAYVINYVSGEEVVRDYVNRAGADPHARWAAFERIMNEPTLPQDLAP